MHFEIYILRFASVILQTALYTLHFAFCNLHLTLGILKFAHCISHYSLLVLSFHSAFCSSPFTWLHFLFCLLPLCIFNLDDPDRGALRHSSQIPSPADPLCGVQTEQSTEGLTIKPSIFKYLLQTLSGVHKLSILLKGLLLKPPFSSTSCIRFLGCTNCAFC